MSKMQSDVFEELASKVAEAKEDILTRLDWSDDELQEKITLFNVFEGRLNALMKRTECALRTTRFYARGFREIYRAPNR